MSQSAQPVVFSQSAPSGTVFDDKTAATLNNQSAIGKLKSLNVADVITTVAIVGLIGLLVWFIVDLALRASRLQKLKKFVRGRRGSKSAPAGDTQNPITETSTGEDSDTVQDGMGELLKQENVPVVIDTGFSDEDSFGWSPGNSFAYGATEYGYQYDPDDFSQNV